MGVMKIFGIIYTIIVSIGAFFHSINKSIDNEKNKTIYKHPNGMTYIDTKGRSRLLSNDELVFYTYDRNGNYVLEDVSGHIYRNFSEEKRSQELNERKEKAMSNKETTYCIDDDNHRKDWVCKGKRFKDFKTGEIYVIRYIKYKYYYINISNGMIVRKTDWQIKQDKKNIKKYLNDYLDIETFNKKQKNIQNKQMLFRDFEYNSSCDYYK